MAPTRMLVASLLVACVEASDSRDCAAGSQCPESVRASSMLQKRQLLVAADGDGLVESVDEEEADNSHLDDALALAMEMGTEELAELQEMERRHDMERMSTWRRGQEEKRRQVELLRDQAVHGPHEDDGTVNCGDHTAASCGECPGEHEDKWSYCRGECKWHGDASSGQCVKWPTDPKITNLGRVLVMTDGGNIFRENSDGSDYRKFIDPNTPCPCMGHTETQRGVDFFTSRPTGIAVDEDEKRIFWTDWLGGTRVQAIDPEKDPLGRTHVRWLFNASVLTAPLDGSWVKPVATTGEVLQSKEMDPIYWEPAVELAWPHFLALDKSKKKVYWTDKRLKKIQRCNYDGSGCELEWHKTEKIPGGIAVDGKGGMVYYSEGTKIYAVPTSGGKAEAIIASVGIVGGLDFDPTQNFVYWTSLGTTRNPGGILRAKGHRPNVKRAEYCGINRRGQRYMKGTAGTCENVVYIPYGEEGMGQGSYKRGAIMTPFDVKGDFANGVLFWSGDEIPGTFKEGVGGKIYRTSLCADTPEQSWEKPAGKEPRGDFDEVTTVKGDPLYPPYVRGVALLSKSFDYDGSVPLAGCNERPKDFIKEAAESKTCHENYEFRSEDGKTCMDFKDASSCSEAAKEACCSCGAHRSFVGHVPTTTTTTEAAAEAASGEPCGLGENWHQGSDAEIQDKVKAWAKCLKERCEDQEEPDLMWSTCADFGFHPADSFCDADFDFGITYGQACPKSCGKC